MDPWNFIAPSSGDILDAIHDKEFSDAYFDMDHENANGRGIPKQAQNENKENFVRPIKIKKELISPKVQDVEHVKDSNEIPSTPEKCQVNIKEEILTPNEPEIKEKVLRRRSMSVSAIMQNSRVGKHISEVNKGIRNMNLNTSIREGVQSTTNIYDTSTSKSLKSFSTCSSQSNLHVTSKFVSMAEAIYHLQRDTPKRFHSYPKKQDYRTLETAINRKKEKNQLLKLTVPQSPALLSKTRTRPVTALSQKDIEDLEVEEIKKFHIRANPISRGVLEGIPNPPTTRRPLTQPEPFNLTQIRKKPVPIEKKIVFTARPVPKHILEKPIELPKRTILVTVPKTPTFMSHRSRSLESVPKASEPTVALKQKRMKFPNQLIDKLEDHASVGHSGVPWYQKTTSHPCKPKPFSFEQRDKERKTKKLEKIQKFLDEEKKMREFHANPLPSVIKKSHISSPKTKVYDKKCDSKKENKENVSEDHPVFKARPPLVLFKEPFVPTRKERPVLEPCQVQLTTEIRARERDLFNQKIKEKEEQHEMLKRLAEEEQIRREEEEKAALRAQLVHKAAPVKHYAPVIIHPSEVPLTTPESPKFASHKL